MPRPRAGKPRNPRKPYELHEPRQYRESSAASHDAAELSSFTPSVLLGAVLVTVLVTRFEARSQKKSMKPLAIWFDFTL